MAKLTLKSQVSKAFMQELLAFQYNDSTNIFTIRKSFDLYFDIDQAAQQDLVELFRMEGGFKTITYADIRQEVFANCNLDQVYTPISAFDEIELA